MKQITCCIMFWFHTFNFIVVNYNLPVPDIISSILFADDTTLVYSSKVLAELSTVTHSALSNIVGWHHNLFLFMKYFCDIPSSL